MSELDRDSFIEKSDEPNIDNKRGFSSSSSSSSSSISSLSSPSSISEASANEDSEETEVRKDFKGLEIYPDYFPEADEEPDVRLLDMAGIASGQDSPPFFYL